MIKEISNFVSSLDPELKALGSKAKDGLHILLTIKNDGERVYIDDTSLVKYCVTKTKAFTADGELFLKKCASLAQLSWSINTNKCFDLPLKAIHSCSPYCVAIKRENLTGGEKYNNNKKSQVYERITAYFEKTFNLIDSEAEKQKIKIFEQAINSESKFNHWLGLIPDYALVKDAEYVIFYLDESVEKYEQTNSRYLSDKLFNTNDYNQQIADEVYGTSDFFNGYPSKKLFLTHQSAYFDIAGRIGAKEAKDLYEFQEIIGRNIFPKPLPIFIHEDELVSKNGHSLKQASIALFKKEAEQGKRISYKEIIEELYNRYSDEFGNYYLLFYDRGVIKDFDFVSKFEYLLVTDAKKRWEILDLFDGDNGSILKDVFDLHHAVLQPVFNNQLVTRTKNGEYQYKYFDDIDTKFCKSNVIYLLVLQYRRAFYDFIYKSKRQAVTQEMFDRILQASILEDIRLDEMKSAYHTSNRSIREKLNIWFSLSENFNLSKPKNDTTMASKLQEHRKFMRQLAKGENTIESDDQYAFAVGQVIYYLMSKSLTSDKSFKRLEPFMQQVHSTELNKAISRMFDTYKHEQFSKNFRNPFAEVLDYETTTNTRNLMATILAGFFTNNELFSSKELNETEEEVVNTEEQI